MWEDLPQMGPCRLNDLASAKAIKYAETAYRRTNRWLDGRAMKLRELSSVIGVILMTGRARHEANWGKERGDRCDPQNILKYISPIDGTKGTAMNALHESKLVRDHGTLGLAQTTRRLFVGHPHPFAPGVAGCWNCGWCEDHLR